MNGLMMNTALTIRSIMRHCQLNHSQRWIASVTSDNPNHKYTYGEAFQRTAKLANALQALGLSQSDRVATMAWNDYRHFELYYAVSCSGYVLHTLNPRLFPEQLTYIVNHAEDKVLFLDPMFVPLLEQVREHLPTVHTYVILTDEAHMPQTSLPNVHCYETLIAGQPDTFEWPDMDENLACTLCYTSGTTGNPKGVLYSHRSTLIHAYAAAMPDSINLRDGETMLPVVPMFHVNAWATPYTCPMVGVNLVFPGPKMGDGQALYELMEAHGVVAAAGVPTVWLALLGYTRQAGKTFSTLKRTLVGGAACPRAVMDEFREQHGVETHHGWGMTEMSPLGTVNCLKAEHADLDEEHKAAIRSKQGRAVFGVEMKVVDDDNNELPWDGKSFGALKVRGPWIASGYFRMESSDAHDEDGWFDTGDVAFIDPEGYMQITDRTKDVIKSGGEWISSIDLENCAVNHPGVAEAAVIGIEHPKWSERPLMIVVRAPDQNPSKEDILQFLEGKIAKFWMPDDVVFTDEIPHTATGKISKLTLRKTYADYRFPGT